VQYPRVGKHTGWHIKPLLLADKSQDLIRRRIGILFSFQVEDTINEYTFIFEVINAS